MIEPCPMPGCDGECEVRFSEDGYVYVHCVLCGYHSNEIHVPDGSGASPTKWVTESHNRLSRIVRAAEEWARLLPHGPSGEYVKAVDALFVAVEGGRSDG